MQDFNDLANRLALWLQGEVQRHSCLTCQYFDESDESCSEADGARPPARVIAFGCPKYNEEPPF